MRHASVLLGVGALVLLGVGALGLGVFLALGRGTMNGLFPLGKGGVVLPKMKWLLMATIDLFLRLVQQPAAGRSFGRKSSSGLHFEYCGSSFLHRG